MGWNRVVPKKDCLVLVGIMVIDRPLTTEKCFKQLFKMTNRKDMTIVVIDNNSNTQTKDVLEKYRKDLDIIVHNDFNIGCAFGVNQYMSYRVPGQHVININVDAHILVEDWLPTMLKVINWEDMGTVSGRRPTLWFDQGRWDIYKNHAVIEEREGIFVEHVQNQIIGPWWMLKGEVIDKIGYMNESTCIDDIDHSVRVTRLGLKNVYLPDVVILQPQDEVQSHPEYKANRTMVLQNWERHIAILSQYNKENLYCGSRFVKGSIADKTYQEMSDKNWIFFKEWSKRGLE